jgi:arsenate reductase (glutaredoxin)
VKPCKSSPRIRAGAANHRVSQNPPSADELKISLIKLKMKPEDLIRKGEEIYKTRFKGKTLGDDEWIMAMSENPILIERPIVFSGKKAVLGRPPEKVREIL